MLMINYNKLMKKLDDKGITLMLLQCQPQDIIDWEVELNPELSYENRYKNAK